MADLLLLVLFKMWFASLLKLKIRSSNLVCVNKSSKQLAMCRILLQASMNLTDF